ncbi:MAG: NAD-dependent dehydratase [Akkermansiaceae bacterium]|nr:NAD-dependent dehydratase [Akkermansiaceae bacterium]
MTILILGATGLTGRETLLRALEDTRVGKVIAPTRRSLPSHPKLVNPVVSELDLSLPEVAHWAPDAVICALGTTIGKAGSKEAFRHVDYALPVAFAKRAHQQGTEIFALISASGASLSIPLFYSRTKGEVERDIGSIGFKSLTIVRPGMIGGDRDEVRLAEHVVIRLATLLRPLLPRGLRVNPASNIAKALVESVVTARPGRHMITSRDLVSDPLR